MANTAGWNAALDKFMTAIAGARKSHWYTILEKPEDLPSSMENEIAVTTDKSERKKLVDMQKHLDILHQSSLQTRSGMSYEEWNSLAAHRGLLQKYGKTYRVQQDSWVSLFTELQIEAEIVHANSGGRGTKGARWYIRLGPKNDGKYHESIHAQDEAGVFVPPWLANGDLLDEQRSLRAAIRRGANDEPQSDEGEGSDSDSSSNTSEDGDSSSEEVDIDEEKTNSSNTNNDNDKTYQSLSSSLGINMNDLTPQRVQHIIGELIAYQRSQSKLGVSYSVPTPKTSSNRTAFTFTQGTRGEEYTAVPMPVHAYNNKEDSAFHHYTKKKPYTKEIVEQMGKSKGSAETNPSLGATRMLKYLAKKHPQEYVEVAKESKLHAGIGVLDSVALAAWKQDCRMKDWQMIKSLAEDHAVDMYLSLRPGLLRLLIEHWVERNHQDSSKIEDQFKRTSKLEDKADRTAQALHSANNPILPLPHLHLKEVDK